jgi:hypothetical protein
MDTHTPKEPTPAQLERLKQYRICVETGTVRGTYKDVGFKIGDYVYIGIDVAGDNKYRHIRRTHVIWWAKTGVWPKTTIDHVDRDPMNDAFSNLREATMTLQRANQGSRTRYSGRIFDWIPGK